MEWITPLLGHTVGLDTAPLIYFIEKHPQYFPTLQPFFEAVGRGEIQIITSANFDRGLDSPSAPGESNVSPAVCLHPPQRGARSDIGGIIVHRHRSRQPSGESRI